MAPPSSSAESTPHLQVAIIGNGIAGSAAARGLALTMSAAIRDISLYEIGRGPGGRASTRKTRAIPAFRVNHGAPYAEVSTREGLDFVASHGAFIAPYSGTVGYVDAATGSFERQSRRADEARIVGEQGEMAAIAGALLLDDTKAPLPRITAHYSTMVRGLVRERGPGHQWILLDKDATEVGRADWLIVTGSGVAHPRWSATFGGEPPLVQAASALDDPQLDEALAVIAQQTAAPVLTALFYGTDEVAEQWRRLGFNLGVVQRHEVLSKISIQPCDGGGCAVVLHSTIAYARANAGVHGSSSSAARVGDASSDTTREEDIIDDMLSALATIPGMPTFEKSRYAFGPLLHRWGNAFPEGPALPADLCVCRNARVAFCGDYVETKAPIGSYECALLSGAAVAESIAEGE